MFRDSQTPSPEAADELEFGRNEFWANIPTEFFKETFTWELGVNFFFWAFYAVAKLVKI